MRTRDLRDLGAAISRLEAVIEATPEGHPGRAGRLSNLGINLGRQYERTEICRTWKPPFLNHRQL